MKKSILFLTFLSFMFALKSNAQFWDYANFTNVFGANPTYLGPQANVDLIFGLDNVEKMRLNTSGQFGIGTNIPGFILDVVASSNLDGINVSGASLYSGYYISDQRVLSICGDYSNIFTGYLAGNNSVTGQYNTVSGFSAGTSLTNNDYNTLVGAYAGTSLAIGEDNTLLGAYAGTSLNGNSCCSYATWNTMTGIDAGKFTVIGFSDNFYGKASGYNCNGDKNCMYGSHAGFGVSGTYTADYNCFFGNWSGYSISGTGTAQANVMIGDSAGFSTGNYITPPSGPTYPSNHNVFVGGFSGYHNPGGNYNTLLGYGTDAYGLSGTTQTITNAAAIGGDAIVRYDNEFILGNNAQSVGIGMVGEGFPLGKLEVFQHSGGTNTIGEYVINTDPNSVISISGTPDPVIGLKSFMPGSKSYYNVAGWFQAQPYALISTKKPTIQQYAIFVPGLWESGWVGNPQFPLVPQSQTLGCVDIGFPFNMDVPDYALDVDGNVRVLSLTYASDSTLKKNQTAFKYGIKAVRNFNPITYKYNGIGGFDTNSTYIGMTAQNLKRNVPGGVVYSQIVKDTITAGDTATIGNIYEEAVLYTAVNAIKEVDSAATSNFNKQQQTNDSLRTGLYSNGWGLTGNAGTTPVTNFVGTTDANALEFKTNAQKSGWIDYTAPGNTSLGYEAENSTTGQWNTAVGFDALYTNTSGGYNTVVGFQSLYTNSTGSYNVSIGTQALEYNTGSDNTAVGYTALTANTSGSDNTAVGYRSLSGNTTGQYNVGMGRDALHANTTASDNIAMGRGALYNTTTGGTNVAYGALAGTTNSTGSNNTFIGYSADQVGGIAPTNSTALGNGTSITASNQVNIGNTSVSTIQGQVNYSTYSDRRIKTNIQNNVPGLTFINKLQPVTYNLNIHQQNTMLGITDSTNANDTGYWNHKYDIEHITFTGLIAQSVDTAAQQCSYNFSGVKKPATPSGLYGLGYTDLVMPLIKSVQQLSSKNDSLNSTVDSLRNAFKNIQSCLTQLCNNGHGASRHNGGGSGNTGDSNATILNTQDVTLSGLANAPLLYQNIPNPFSTSAKINYYLPANTQGAIIVFYDSYGNKLKDVQLSQTGNGTINLTPENLTSGIYSYSLVVNGNVIDTKRMILQK